MAGLEPLLPPIEEPEEDTPEWRESAGDREANEGNFSRAIGHYKRAAKLDPKGGRLTRVADAYIAADMPQQALAYYQKALQMDSRDPEATPASAICACDSP